MITRASTRWNLWLAGLLCALLITSLTFAQQPAEQPSTPPDAPPAASQPPATPAATPIPSMQPQPTAVPGRPDIPNAEVATQLRGIPAPPFAAPPDQLPTPHLKLPKGFKIEVYASGIPNARSLRLGDKGTVFVSNRQLDKVYAIVDKHGKREAIVIASGLDRPNGLAFRNGTLYIAEGTQISKLEHIEDHLDNPPKPVVIYNDFLNHQSHGWKFMGLGPDNKLYVNVGSPCNICEPPETNGQLRRINLDGSSPEAVVRGVRNSVGFDWHPKTKELWFTDHGRDWAGDKGVEDELNKVSKPGGFYGFPYCHNHNTPDPDVKKPNPCEVVTKPVALLGAHAAGMGIKFYTGKMFPAEYQNTAFIARKGSWNREKPNGFDVVNVRIGDDGKAAIRPFMTGFNESKEAYKFWGRPAYIAQMPDGALLVSDEQVGAIYRVSYQKPKAPAKK
jgi:glucose/arabinose dehydrogenase